MVDAKRRKTLKRSMRLLLILGWPLLTSKGISSEFKAEDSDCLSRVHSVPTRPLPAGVTLNYSQPPNRAKSLPLAVPLHRKRLSINPPPSRSPQSDIYCSHRRSLSLQPQTLPQADSAPTSPHANAYSSGNSPRITARGITLSWENYQHLLLECQNKEEIPTPDCIVIAPEKLREIIIAAIPHEKGREGIELLDLKALALSTFIGGLPIEELEVLTAPHPTKNQLMLHILKKFNQTYKSPSIIPQGDSRSLTPDLNLSQTRSSSPYTLRSTSDIDSPSSMTAFSLLKQSSSPFSQRNSSPLQDSASSTFDNSLRNSPSGSRSSSSSSSSPIPPVFHDEFSAAPDSPTSDADLPFSSSQSGANVPPFEEGLTRLPSKQEPWEIIFEDTKRAVSSEQSQ